MAKPLVSELPLNIRSLAFAEEVPTWSIVQSTVPPCNDFFRVIWPPSPAVGEVGFKEISPGIVPLAFPTVNVVNGDTLPMPTLPPFGFNNKL